MGLFAGIFYLLMIGLLDLPTLELAYQTLGCYGTLDTVILQRRPLYPLDEGTVWIVKFSHHAESKIVIIHGIRAASYTWIEYVLHVYDEVQPLLLLVPISYATRIPIPTSRKTLSLCNDLRKHPWVLEDLWTQVLNDSNDGSDLDAISTFVCKYPFMSTQSIVITPLALCISGNLISPTHLLHATNNTLAIGDFVTVLFWPTAEITQKAKIVGIRAMEQDWLELAMQIYPAGVRTLGRRFLRLVVARNNVQLNSDLCQFYDTNYLSFPTLFKKAKLSLPVSLDIV